MDVKRSKIGLAKNISSLHAERDETKVLFTNRL